VPAGHAVPSLVEEVREELPAPVEALVALPVEGQLEFLARAQGPLGVDLVAEEPDLVAKNLLVAVRQGRRRFVQDVQREARRVAAGPASLHAPGEHQQQQGERRRQPHFRFFLRASRSRRRWAFLAFRSESLRTFILVALGPSGASPMPGIPMPGIAHAGHAREAPMPRHAREAHAGHAGHAGHSGHAGEAAAAHGLLGMFAGSICPSLLHPRDAPHEAHVLASWRPSSAS
jgi:hypothetical protein